MDQSDDEDIEINKAPAPRRLSGNNFLKSKQID